MDAILTITVEDVFVLFVFPFTCILFKRAAFFCAKLIIHFLFSFVNVLLTSKA